MSIIFRPLGANRKYPFIPTVTGDPVSHTNALRAISEAILIHERRTQDIDNSFVRVHELVDMGLITIKDGQFNVIDISIEDISGIDIDPGEANTGDVIVWNGETQAWEIGDHGDIAGLGDDDHPQYTAWAQAESIIGQWQWSTSLWGPNGTEEEPSFTFTSDTDTGMYRVGANNLGLAVGGEGGGLVWDINTTRVRQEVLLHGPDGSDSDPTYSFYNDDDTGIYRVGANNLGIATAGVLHWDINTTRTYQDVSAEIQYPTGITDPQHAADTRYDGLWVLNPDVTYRGGIQLTTLTGVVNPELNGTGSQLAFWEVENLYGFRIRNAGQIDNEGDLDFYRHANNATGVLFLKMTRDSSQVQFAAGTASAPVITTFGDLDTGIYFPSSDSLGIATGSGEGFFSSAGSHRFESSTYLWRIANGTNATPAYSFEGDVNTGMYRPASANNIGFATDGTQRLNIADTEHASSGGIQGTLSFRGPAGSTTIPSFTFASDSNTGFYNSATDAIGVVTGGTLRATWTTAALVSTVVFSAPDGADTAPAYAFTNDLDCGLYRITTNTIGVATAGVERLRVTGDGAWGLGGASYGADGDVLTSHGSALPPTWEAGGVGGGGGGARIVIDVFTSSTTWSKPADARTVEVVCIASGGGGGGARKQAVGQTRSGGGGGGGGGVSRMIFDADDLTDPATVTVGVGGTGGTGASADTGTGTDGGAGGPSAFDDKIRATGGGLGNGATAATNAGGAGGTGTLSNGGAGGTGGTSTSTAGSDANYAGSGGGGGGGVSSANNESGGKAGGTVLFTNPALTGGTAGGAGGVNGGTGNTLGNLPGSGGGGGGGEIDAGSSGGDGGDAGDYGGGGGGGGGCTNGAGIAGDGGDGGDGLVIVVSYCNLGTGVGIVEDIVEGDGILVDDTDPLAPIVSVDESFDFTWTGDHVFNEAVTIEAAGPALVQIESDQAVDSRRWTSRVAAGAWSLGATLDDATVFRAAFSAQRNAASSAITAIEIANATNNPPVSVLGSGQLLKGEATLVTTPDYSFVSDPDTGIWRSAANVLNLTAGGTTAARVGSTQFIVDLAFRMSGILSPAQITGNTDNYAPTGIDTATAIRISTDASRNLTGISATVSFGRHLYLHNIGAQNLVLVHDATSTAANRFYCPGSANFTLNANDNVLLIYDATSSRWRVIAA